MTTELRGAALGEPDVLLVRYGEIALKGDNRRQFERALVRNVKAATAGIAPVRVERVRGRLLVWPQARAEALMRRLADVFGIVSISPAWKVLKDPEAIALCARLVFADALAAQRSGAPVSLCVRARRADKRFAMPSPALEAFVAERVLEEHPHCAVDLEHATIELGIDVRLEGAYVFARRSPGPGGLPVGTLGRGICLLSGGIDSPVAAWLALKRGLALHFLGFHSEPWIGPAQQAKIRALARILARHQARTRLFVAPFADVQVAIRECAPSAYRTVLYRRMMHRIGAALAQREGAGALVTGDSLGQVASQTLENLACIEAAADLPVLRPLIGFDKLDTIRLAERIGTFSVSVPSEPDCCSVFQPERPVVRGSLEVCLEAERRFDVAGLVAASLAGLCAEDVEAP